MAQETESIKLVVLDTSILIDYLRNHQPAVTYIQEMNQKKEKMSISIVTETELLAGQSCNEPIIRTGVMDMLNSFKKIEVNNAIAVKAGDICRKYGATIPDALIAATTMLQGATLLTKNVKDFKQIEGLLLEKPY